MTMTALPPAPATPPASASAGSTGGKATDSASGASLDGEFAALVALSLGEQAGEEPSEAAVTPDAAVLASVLNGGPTVAPTSDGCDPTDPDVPADTANPGEDAAPAAPSAPTVDVATLLLVPAQTIAVVALLTAVAPPVIAPVPGQPAAGTSPVGIDADAIAAGTTVAGEGAGDEQLTSAKAPVTAPAKPAGAKTTPLSGTPTAGANLAAVNAAGPATHKASETTGSDVPNTQTTATVQTATPVSGLASVSSSAAAPTASSSAATVTRQVFPEVARLVSRGDGTQRITLRLTPDNLGEVKVMLTVRDGAVQVSLSAGAHAQEALRTGSHELHRLLEMVGANSSQIKVSDLSGANTSSTSDFGADDHGFHQPGSDGDHQPAGRRTPSNSAGDGHSAPGAAPLLSTNPGTSASVSGVDVRM